MAAETADAADMLRAPILDKHGEKVQPFIMVSLKNGQRKRKKNPNHSRLVNDCMRKARASMEVLCSALHAWVAPWQYVAHCGVREQCHDQQFFSVFG